MRPLPRFPWQPARYQDPLVAARKRGQPQCRRPLPLVLLFADGRRNDPPAGLAFGRWQFNTLVRHSTK